MFDGETLRPRGPFNQIDLPIQDLEFSPDGTRLAAVGASEVEGIEPNRLMLWDPWTGAQALTLGEPGLRLWAVSFSPDGRQLITGGSGGFIRVFDSLPWWFPSELRGTAHGNKLVPETSFSRAYWLDRLDAIRSTAR